MKDTDTPQEEFTTAQIRAACRKGFYSALPHVLAIARGEIEDAPFYTTVKALETLGKYGIGRTSGILIENAEWLEIIVGVTNKHIADPEAFDAWWQEVKTEINKVS